MCTVVVSVPDRPGLPTRLLAVRDEHPDRPWRPMGAWWPEHPEVQGVQDVQAGGAWLATSAPAGRLAVLLNVEGVAPHPGLVSRGRIVLDAVNGTLPTGEHPTQAYSLLVVTGHRTRHFVYDGNVLHDNELTPGVHMLVNSAVVDDPGFARVPRWLPRFRDSVDGFPESWQQVLAESARLPAVDDAAIIRDNRPYGYPTLSLLAVFAEVTDGRVDTQSLEFPAPGQFYGD
ncbi:MAG: NRDE family protein [Brooklawnia sp.]|jgi:uncharacterized protein with NRDE domain